MDTQGNTTTTNYNNNFHRGNHGNRDARHQLDWEFEVDFVQGPITARVTVLRFEMPQYSVVVGTPRPDGSIKPFVPYKATSLEQLEQLEQLGSCYTVTCDEAHKYVMAKLREAVEALEARERQLRLKREKDQADAAQRALLEKERKARKSKNWENNHVKRAEENRQRARGGSGKKKG